MSNNDKQIPLVWFVELFHMSLANFMWLFDELRDNLVQDPLGHGVTYVTIGHVFNIGKATTNKSSHFFVIIEVSKMIMLTA
ncbi:hypothetical protein VP01_61g5 [Puccinia sorghi]|uniref:Uncharacterized protein n=1 Tax=Puccinia sorghi TaxID=27349 RepID=A0A0L6UHH5_9BASI|nr:hypothetical protein VP01_61g5 [Puccinia sorghi]